MKKKNSQNPDPAFLECIRNKAITWLRCGKSHPKFTGIWMVETGGRVFGRSYFLRERSWYTTFLEERHGEIKCGDTVWKVSGVKPRHLDKIMESINKAYENKYSVKPHNVKWVEGLRRPDRVAKTMEFILE